MSRRSLLWAVSAIVGVCSSAVAETVSWGVLPVGNYSQKISNKTSTEDPDIFTFEVQGPATFDLVLSGNTKKVEAALVDGAGMSLGVAGKSGRHERLQLALVPGAYGIRFTTAQSKAVAYKATLNMNVKVPGDEPNTDGFVPDDVIVSGSLPLRDPEFNAETMKVIWESSGKLLATDVDPATGFFNLDTITTIDTGVVFTPKNGPEWATAGEDRRVVYTKAGSGGSTALCQASLLLGGDGTVRWVVSPVAGSEKGTIPKGSSDIREGVPLVVYMKGDLKKSPITVWSQLSSPLAGGNISSPLASGRFIPDDNALLGFRSVKGFHQIVRYDLATAKEAILTKGKFNTLFPFAFRSPEAGNAVKFVALEVSGSAEFPADASPLVIYEQNGSEWTAAKRISSPSPSYSGLYSAEPFVFKGKSYVSFVTWNENQGPSEVWIASLDPASTFVRRVSGEGVISRNDPETVVTDSTVFVYYTEILPDGTRVQHRCLTGL